MESYPANRIQLLWALKLVSLLFYFALLWIWVLLVVLQAFSVSGVAQAFSLRLVLQRLVACSELLPLMHTSLQPTGLATTSTSASSGDTLVAQLVGLVQLSVCQQSERMRCFTNWT